ncbi:MAG: coenzyme F420-0:L-glutamate ligase [bacterium]|nr:coenzyme F420-0:L-glutamate ligase [bacterium]
MIVKAIKTQKVLPNGPNIFELLDGSIKVLPEGTVVAITSKVVSICEGRVVPIGSIDKEKLVKRESDYFTGLNTKYGFGFTIAHNTLIPMAGIDESNGGGFYVLWPLNPQKTANDITIHLKKRFGRKKVGVVITDSTCTPLRWGTSGIALAYSGFRPTNNYVGKADLFGRPFSYSKSGVATGLAAAAVLTMGEGIEQTPLAVISDVPFITFQDHDPTPQELDLFKISNVEDDLFAPFLSSVKWLPGVRKGK